MKAVIVSGTLALLSQGKIEQPQMKSREAPSSFLEKKTVFLEGSILNEENSFLDFQARFNRNVVDTADYKFRGNLYKECE